MSESIHVRVRREIEDLHEFFFDWFRGDAAVEIFESRFTARFSSDLVFIPPAGRLLGLEHLRASVRAGHGSNPDFRVAIRNVAIQREWSDFVLATYEEWQRNALASTPPDNGRIATVLFSRAVAAEPSVSAQEESKVTTTLRWLHIHETWLPEGVMKAGPYDF